jgi:cell division protein FtsI/penicillin-binding protein 2
MLMVLAPLAATLALGAGGPTAGLPAASIAASAPPMEPAFDPLARIDFDKRVRVGDVFYAPRDGGGQAVLTLDPAAQARAEAVLEKADAPYGAIVVMTPDGRVLALAGRSTKEPGLASSLAVTPWAPSASIFKVVTAAALLDAGRDERVCVHGGLRAILEEDLVDDPRRDSFCGDLGLALARSQNAMIGKLAARHLDAATLDAFATRFGYDTRLDFPMAVAPSPAEIPEERLERARAAAGFWHSELSPLTAAQLMAVVAGGGQRPMPHLVSGVVDATGFRAIVAAPATPVLDPAIAGKLGRMLVGTTETGTARTGFQGPRGRILPYRVAGKTGSLARRGADPLDYSWFVGFAPAEEPRVIVAVLLGNAPAYRLKAHTAARLVLETVLESRHRRGVQQGAALAVSP